MKKSSRVISTLLLGSMITTAAPNVFAVEAKDVVTKKLAGDDRFQTAIQVSDKFEKVESVVLVNWEGLPDALAATPFAKMKNAPILFTKADKLTEPTAKQIEKLGAKTVYVIGGEKSVSEDVVKELEKSGKTVERIAGDDRYETSEAVAKKMGKVEKVAIVNGVNGIADALSVAAPAAKNDMAIILSNGKEINAGKEIVDNAKTKYVVGGKVVVDQDLVDEVKAKRLAGDNRNATNAEVIKEFYNDSKFENIYVSQDGATNKEKGLVDALAAGPLAGKEGAPVVLAGSSLEKAQKEALETIGKKEMVKTAYEVGGKVNQDTFKAIVKALEVREVVTEVKSMSAKVVADNKVVVTFDAPVADANHTNFEINGGLAVTKAVVAEDKKSVELTTNVSFVDGKSYEVTATGLKNANQSDVKDLKASFKYEIGKYQAPTLSKTEFEVGENIKDFVVVKDANGIAISADKYSVTGLECDVAGTIDTTTGKVISAVATAAQVRVSVTMYTGDVVDGTPVTIKVSVPKQNTGFVNAGFKKSTDPAENAVAAQRGGVVTTLAKEAEDNLYVYTKDSKGNPEDDFLNLSVAEKQYVIKNNAPTIAEQVEITNDGALKVKGLKAGKASFTITNKDGFKQTVEFTVTEANNKYKDLNLSATATQLVKANLMAGSTAEENVNQKTVAIDWVDQDNNVASVDFTAATTDLQPSAKQTLTVTNVTKDDAEDRIVVSTQSDAITLTGASTGVVINTKDDVKAQDAKITVSYFEKGAKTAKTVKTINVAIKEAGDHAKYVIEQVGALDAGNPLAQKVSFKTYSVDIKGVKRDDVTADTTFEFKAPLAANVDHWIGDIATNTVGFDATNNAAQLLNYDGEFAIQYKVDADAISEHVVKFTNSKNVQKSVTVSNKPVSVKLAGLDTVSVDQLLFGKANSDEVLVDADGTTGIFAVKIGQDGYKYNAPLVSVIGKDGKAMASGVNAYGIQLNETNKFEYKFKELGELKATTRIVNKTNLVEGSSGELSVGDKGASATFTIVVDSVNVKDDKRLANADEKVKAEANLLAAPVTIDVTLTKALSESDIALQSLRATIESAKNKCSDTIIEGEVAGNYIVGSKATLQSAIDAANLIEKNTNSTTKQLNDAKTELDNAIDKFNSSKVVAIDSLVAPTDLVFGGSNPKVNGVITGYTKQSGETLAVTSGNATVLTIDAETGLAVTAKGEGNTDVTVKVKNADGNVIKVGKVNVKVVAGA